MELGLRDRVALVTGGSMGIGKATALALAREGAHVAICARGKELLESVAAEIAAETERTVLPIVADLNKEEDAKRFVREAVDHFGRLDILVNCAGSSPGGTLQSLEEEQWMESLNLKFMGYVRTTKSAVGHMKERGWGRVINVIGNDGIKPIYFELTPGAANAAGINFTLAIAEELAPRFADGCVFVPIAPAADLPAATSLLASTLGVSEEVGESLEATLIDHLRDRHLLLFLDGFEHLAEDAPFVSRLLGACPELTVLVTSRVCLRIAGEQEFPVAPLPVPDLTPPLRAESLAVCDSVALFVDRAARASPDFALTEDNAGVVGSICVRLEGLPLALELAARRIKLLHPRALLAQLEGPGPSLRLLTGGGPDLPRRQRTLRETIKWSYDLLSDHEQRVLRRMAVFMHSADLDAIGAVCGFATEADGAEDRVNVIDALGALVDHSLVSRREGPAGQARFAMLDTIREFAQERLAASGEDADMRERHARYFIEVVETAGPVLLGAADHAAVVAAEQGNMQAALRWLVAAS